MNGDKCITISGNDDLKEFKGVIKIGRDNGGEPALILEFLEDDKVINKIMISKDTVATPSTLCEC